MTPNKPNWSIINFLQFTLVPYFCLQYFRRVTKCGGCVMKGACVGISGTLLHMGLLDTMLNVKHMWIYKFFKKVSLLSWSLLIFSVWKFCNPLFLENNPSSTTTLKVKLILLVTTTRKLTCYTTSNSLTDSNTEEDRMVQLYVWT